MYAVQLCAYLTWATMWNIIGAAGLVVVMATYLTASGSWHGFPGVDHEGRQDIAVLHKLLYCNSITLLQALPSVRSGIPPGRPYDLKHCTRWECVIYYVLKSKPIYYHLRCTLFKSNLLFYSLHYAKTYKEFERAYLHVIEPGQHSSFQRNFAVRFQRPRSRDKHVTVCTTVYC